MTRIVHQPVLLKEVLDLLQVKPDALYVDGTVGEGGHAEAILEASSPSGNLIGLDLDPSVLRYTRERLSTFKGRFELYNESYDRLDEVFFLANVDGANAILLDLGFSSFQVEDPARGWSFQLDAPLDMRYDRSKGDTAKDLLNRVSKDELIRILRDYGEERFAKRIASNIVRKRAEAGIRTTGELANLVLEAVPAPALRRKIHPATRVFQALRIAVNLELEHLRRFLDNADRWLAPGGRLAVISYHSLEDRMVKQCMQDWNSECICPKSMPKCVCRGVKLFKTLTRKPVFASAEEVASNPRSRSARLRVAERL